MFSYVKQINKKVELEVICENINQDDEIFWNSRTRKSDKGAGIGQNENFKWDRKI